MGMRDLLVKKIVKFNKDNHFKNNYSGWESASL